MPSRRLAAILLLLIAPLTRADQASDTADLVAMLRAIHVDRCNAFSWRGPGHPMVISDRPSATDINEITKRPFKVFGIALLTRAPAGTLWPHVTLCPGIGVVDHLRLERVLAFEDAADDHGDAFTLAFGDATYEEVSLPAFSPDKNRAIVYRAHMCPLCGDGTYFELTRTSSGWRVSRWLRAWVS